ncbi:MAG: hypothetical protein U1F21_11605 [Sphaerotilus natans]
MAGQTVGNWRASDELNVDVKVGPAPQVCDSTADIARLMMLAGQNADGSARLVRLDQIAELGEDRTPQQITAATSRARSRSPPTCRAARSARSGRHPPRARERAAAAGPALALRRLDQGHGRELDTPSRRWRWA